MIYENNEQVKTLIKHIMKKEEATYDDIALSLNTTKQNSYKILNKNQLKLDDVKKFCEALGYKFDINIVKGDKIESDLYDFYINDEFMELVLKLVQLGKDIDAEKIRKRHLELKAKNSTK